MTGEGRKRYLDVLSDGTGATAERVLRAALVQFPEPEVEIRRHARVRDRDRAEPILRRAVEDRSLLVFSVVSPELSAYLHERTQALHLEAVDVIGSVIERLGVFLAQQPIHRPGPLLPLTDEYFRRIEAVEFTVKSDAGKDPRMFTDADLVLLGVSRTSKTPLATLLAQRGLRVANHTVVVDKPLPDSLLALSSQRIVGLTIDIDALCAIRQERLEKLGMPAGTQYGVRPHVEREVRYAENLFAEHPSWPVVDTTGRSIDETAGIILERMSERRPTPPRRNPVARIPT
ncbi:MAG: pyruvate, water dikinase regulatory protein [Myxococcota bacterium]